MEHKEYYLERAHQLRDVALGISAIEPVVAQELFALAADMEAAAREDELLRQPPQTAANMHPIADDDPGLE